MKRSLAAGVAVTLAVALSGCAEQDPDRFDNLYTKAIAAMDDAPDDADPASAGDFAKTIGWDSEDSRWRVAQYEVSQDKTTRRLCFVDTETEVYMMVLSEDAEGWGYFGDGDCSTDPADAEVVINTAATDVVKGADLVPSVVRDLGEGAQALAEADVRNAGVRLDTWIKEHPKGDTADYVPRLEEGLILGNTMTEFDGGVGTYSFCVVHEATGAWATYTSKNGPGMSGTSGAACDK